MSKWTVLVETSYCAAGMIVENDVVVDAAPIYRWAIGKQWTDVKKWKKITRLRGVRLND